MTLYVFDTTKRDAAIAQFALDNAKCADNGYPLRMELTANNIAAFLREFFDAPTSQKLIAQKVGSASGITGNTPAQPLPSREQP